MAECSYPSFNPLKKRDSVRIFVLNMSLVQPNGEQLTKISMLIEEGKVVPHEVEEMPLSQAQRRLINPNGTY